jgi:SAM-dependent methyltransferase
MDISSVSAHQFEHYERVLYPCGAYPQAHPERLAMMGILFGLHPAPLDTCRILELGCGDGAHLIPIAYHFPTSECIGLDLSPAHIQRGQAYLEKLGLHNCTLRVEDILHVDYTALGTFDYIIAHGVFSWVPAEVRTALLALCQHCLQPQGIAYISYNTQPGGHIRTMVREMMLYAAGHLTDPHTRVQTARQFLSFMAESVISAKTGTPEYQSLLQAEVDRIQSMPDHVLFHDDLDEYARPFSFTEFMAMAHSHDLQYLGEADLVEMQEHFFTPEIQERLVSYGGEDVIRREQLLDFMKYRRFRQTLLCKAGQPIEHMIYPDTMKKLWFVGSAHPHPYHTDMDIYVNTHGVEFLVTDSIHRLVLDVLTGQYPRALSSEEILQECIRTEQSYTRLRTPAYSVEDIHDVLVALLMADMILCSSVPVPCINDAMIPPLGSKSYYPKATHYARLQAEMQSDVTNIRHTDIHLTDPIARAILVSATGENSSEVLEIMISHLIETTSLTIPDEYRDRPTAGEKLSHALHKLAFLGLLME